MTADQSHGPDVFIVPTSQVKALLATLDETANYRRDRTATCADCADQSCTTCRWWLQAAAYDQTAAQRHRGLCHTTAWAGPHGTDQQRAARGRRSGGWTAIRRRPDPAARTASPARQAMP